MEEKKEVKQYDEKLSQEFFTILEERRISQSMVAREIGVSASLISAYKSGTYNGDIPCPRRQNPVILKT
jgi:DNA transposition AAA+ family ATPase